MLGEVTDALSCIGTTTTMSDYTDGGGTDTSVTCSVSASATDIVADKTQGDCL
jgi:hypothetical protein